MTTTPQNSVGKILVVDDEVELKNALVETLSMQSYEAHGYTSAHEALEVLRHEDFDLLLSDLMMPEMDGISLIKAALDIDPHLVAIVMTGQGTIQTAVDAMKAGTFDYVLKPFRLQTLAPVLTRGLNQRRLSLENLQLRETVAIYELSQTIAFTLDRQTIISKVADAAVQQTDADEVSILLPTSDGAELYVAAVRGKNRQRLLGERVPLGESISGWVAQERSPLILEGEVHDERFRPVWPHPEICSAIAMPMQVANKLVGIINLNSLSRARPFTLGQRKALAILASTAAAALESSALYEQVLRAEENYRSIFQNAVEGIYQITPDGRFISANPAMAQMLGFESAEELMTEVSGVTNYLYVDPHLRREFVRALQENDTVTGFEVQHRRKDGSIIILSESARTVRDANGEVLYYEGIAEDVTERRREEQRQLRRIAQVALRADVIAALAERDTSLRQILEHCAQALVHHLKAAFARIWTLNAQENVLELQGSAGVHTPTDDAQSRVPVGTLKIGRIAETRRPHITNDVQSDPHVSDKEWAKREGIVSFAGYPLLLEDRLVGVMALFARADLTEDVLDALATVADLISQGIERKRAEEALRDSEERYRDLVENAHDIIYSHDLQGNYTSVNKAGEQITGYTREEVLASNLDQIITPECLDKAHEMLSRKLRGERVTAYELEIVAKDGHRIAVEVNTKLVFQDGVPVGVQGIARDVTGRKQLEDQLRQSQKMEAIGRLAGGVAHDFNNLLTAINGYSSLALQRLEDQHPIRANLEEIKKAGDRAANLTRQLLAFGRKQILQPIPLNLNDVVTDMNRMLRRLIGEDIQLDAILAPDLKRVTADPGQIEQVLVNLVVNARDAMPQGGKLIIETANVEFDGAYQSRHIGVQPGNYVMLAVSDTGVGMDEKTKKQIFEPFFTTKEKGKGTGLGLSTVYGIVKQTGGHVWVYSEPGQGTTFKVYLPQLDLPIKQGDTEPIDETISAGSETILLVEDEEVVRGLARIILQQAGYNVLEAKGGEQAMRLFSEHSEPINLLLTDVVMPETSGKEVADRLRKVQPGIKVLFMSGYTDEAIVHHGVLDSNVEFIQKPFTPAALARKVREVIDSKETTGESRENPLKRP
jgi:two-component system cell cycle sensor histidine kinase/response regulator CckA